DPRRADRANARIYHGTSRGDARRRRAAPLAQPRARLPSRRRRGTPRVAPLPRAAQREPRLSRSRKGIHGTGALTVTALLLWLALLGPSPRLITTGELADLFAQRDSSVSVVDARNDYTVYLEGHIPRAVYLNVEELRAADRGVPNKVLGLPSYAALFSRLGIRPDRPVVIYSAGETRDIDATYLAWILEGLGHPSVYVLDGGFGKWSLENRMVTRRYPAVDPTAFVPAAFTPARATLEDVRAALTARDVVK